MAQCRDDWSCCVMGVQYDFGILKEMVWHSNVMQLEMEELKK